MRILVTGGLGVNGVWVVQKLLECGLEPIVADIRQDFSLAPDLEAKVDFQTLDVTNMENVEQVLAQSKVAAIIHLAAFIDPEMDHEPFRAFRVNSLGTVNLLEAARNSHVRRFVSASSRAVYGATPEGVGEPHYQSIPETYPKRPVKAYDVTKLGSEQMGQVYRDVYGLEFAALRFAGIYGPGKQARHGKMSLRSRLVEDPVKGIPVRVERGGDQKDDMIYVDDGAEALVRAVLADALPHSAYNIGSGKGQTLREVADAVRAAVPGADIYIGPGLNPLGFDVHRSAVFDCSLAHQDFGYSPKFDLMHGIADYVRHLRSP